MIKYIATALLGLLMLAAPAMAQTCEPWIAYGQTATVVNGSVNNPATNHTGVRGEASLPFPVPTGHELVLEAIGLEGYSTIPGGLVLFPWVGAPPVTTAKALHSVYADNATNSTSGFKYYLPAGSILNAMIQSNETSSAIVGWYISGELCAAP